MSCFDAALDLVDELEALAGLLRLELEAHVRVLAAAAGLLDVLVLVVDGNGDRLAVRNLRSANVALDVEFAFQTVNDDLEVELAHAGDDRLGSLLIEADDEGRVFHRESVQSDAELLVVATALRLDGDRDDGRREVDGFKRDRMLRIAKRVARTRLGKTDASDDVAGAGLVERLLLGGVHAEETADALLLTDRRVEKLGTKLERTRIDADEGDLAHVLVGHDLERKAAERLVVADLALLAGIIGADRRTCIERRRQVVANRVEERLNALITLFYKAPSTGEGIHPSAVVDETAKLGENVALGPNVVVCAGAEIGDNTRILANAFVGENSKIGKNCLLHAGVNLGSNTILGDRVIINHGASIGADGFSFVTETPDNIEKARKDGGEIKETNENQVVFKIPSLGGVKIGNDVEIGANACIDKGTIEYTQIGDQTKIDNLVQIGHNCKVGKACMIVSQAGIAGSCVIGDRVVIAGQAGLADHLTVGSDSIVMAQAGVSKSFPEKSIIVGAPAVPRKEFIRQLQTMKKAEQLIKKFQSYEKVLNAELPDNEE